MDELARAHTVAMAVLRDMIVRLLRGAWDGLPAYNEDDVARWLAQAVPILDAGQRQAVSLTDAYLARAMERQPLGIDPALVTGAAVRAGTTPEEEWRRPFVTLWTALSRGVAYEQAVRDAWERADAMAQLDVQLSMRATAREVGLRDDGIYGWRRVTDGNACDLCLIASTQRYHRGDLMPIHARCGCTVAPLTSPSDQIVDRSLYGELKASGAMQRRTAQRQRARGEEPLVAAVRRHGELGPVLVNARDHFTTAAEIAA
jgi:hypothetical protein